MSERYVDPNSGAAMQPGGFAAGVTKPAPTSEASEASAPEPPAEESSEEQVESTEEESSAGDYSELLSKTKNDIEAYVAQHPEEKAAIIAAEEQRERPRKGVLEL